jgi:hypothetical protein
MENMVPDDTGNTFEKGKYLFPFFGGKLTMVFQ